MPPIELILRLLLAAVLGAGIGLEREYHRKPAGLRTNILIALGSALFTMMSMRLGLAGHNEDRISSTVVSGIGFLGAGAIMRHRESVTGMTTAATIWVNAAVGMAVGAGEYAMASLATLITLLVLAALAPAERYFERRASSPAAANAASSSAPDGPPAPTPRR